MEKTAASVILCALTLLLLSLAGCGGGDSTPPPEAPTAFRLSGVVEDGPIENAKISLRDQENNILAVSNSVTDATGNFSLQVPAGTLFTNLSVVAVGGRDSATGVDFTGLELRSPLELFSDDVSATVISPLTTLVAKLHEQGIPLAVAQERLRAWLALPPATNLAARPSTSLDLQRRTLLLSKIALEIKSVAPESDPFSRIGTQISVTDTLNAAIANPESMSALGLDVASQTRVQDRQMSLAAATTVDDAVFIYKREELLGIFAANVEQMLVDSTSFDPLNASYRENLRLVTEATLQAAGREVMTLGGTIPQRIARYILFTYKLRTWESLTVDAATFASALIPLTSDPWVAELARSRSLYSVVSPLQLSELPGNDNQHRLAYFYGSDLSPHYQAEQLLGRVFDDAINDAVLLKVVEGKANAGLIDETRMIIATQIMQSEAKANAYRALGNALISFGRMAEAREDLLRARDLYIAVIESKGKASASSTDTINLYDTAKSLSKAGYLDAAGTVLQYLDEVSKILVGNAAAINRLVAGFKNIADAYIAAGDLQTAAPVVDLLYGYAQEVPASLSSGVMTYWTRVISLGNTAKLYADLDNRDKVLQIYGQIQALRTADGFQNKTGALTWYLTPALVETLFRVGETGEALALANSIPAANVKDQAKAFKLVATIVALNGNLDTAYEMVAGGSYFPEPEDKIEALTYRASSKSSEYIGLALIKAGRFDEARIALEKAELVLAGMTETTDENRYTYLIHYGYVKVADLYFMMGDSGRAATLLLEAREVIKQVSGVKFVIDGLVDIALGYQQIGQPAVAFSLLQEAWSRADATLNDPTLPVILPVDAALLYEALVKAYLQIDAKQLAIEVAAPFWQRALAIHTPGAAYTGTANDDLASKEVDTLLRAAKYLVSAGYRTEALTVLAAARATADEIIDEDKRLPKYINPDFLKYPHINHLIGGYANAREYDQALSLALELKYMTNRYQAIHYLADYYIRQDDFPDTWVATIDSDNDGQPDFFNSLASAAEIAASGLLLDDDSDGDGKVDTLDLRPLFAD